MGRKASTSVWHHDVCQYVLDVLARGDLEPMTSRVS